jgi:hypothetical protein
VKLLPLQAIAVSALLIGSGCSSQGDAVPINLASKPASESTSGVPTNPVTIVVTPFADDRSDRTKLGLHQTLWGSSEPLVLKSGTVGEVTASGLAEFLGRKGWRVRYVPSAATATGADVVISGKVLESSVDAHGSLGSTDIAAKQKIVVHAKNERDGSSITDTVSHQGIYSVFWFSPQDAEVILSEVMERNFDKFATQTKFDGTALRFR